MCSVSGGGLEQSRWRARLHGGLRRRCELRELRVQTVAVGAANRRVHGDHDGLRAVVLDRRAAEAGEGAEEGRHVRVKDEDVVREAGEQGPALGACRPIESPLKEAQAVAHGRPRAAQLEPQGRCGSTVARL